MFTIGIDQYNNVYHNLGKHPRKELLERLGRKSASKMFVDKTDGRTVCTGYVIGGLWISIFRITPWGKEA